jgi:ABC-2 type transport system ATP-binding protein
VEFDKDPSQAELAAIPNVRSVLRLKSNLWQVEAEGEEDIRPSLFSFAVQNKLTVLSLQKQENNLEEVFRHLTKG